MISGKSLDDITRALKMAQDDQGRPAYSASDIEEILREAVRRSSIRDDGISRLPKYMVPPSASIRHCYGPHCHREHCHCFCEYCDRAKKADH